MKIIINVHNRRSTTAVQKSIEMVESLKLCSPENEFELLCTSDQNRFFVKKENLNGITITQFPDFLWGKLRQGIDLYNSLRRIIYLCSNSNFDILHSIDSRPVVLLSSLFSKFLLKKPLVLGWWDFSGKGGISEQRFGKFYSKTFGNIEYTFDRYLRRKSNANLVVSSGMFEKIKKINPNAINKWIRVGAKEDNRSLSFNFTNIEKYNYVFYCGALSSSEKEFMLKTANYLKGTKIKFVIAGTGIQNKSDSLINFGFLENFDDVLSLIKHSKFCILPFENTEHNNLRWPSKISDYCKYGKMIVSTPLNQIELIDEKFYLLSKYHTVESFGEAIIESFNFDKSLIDKFENESKLFFNNHLSNRNIGLKINDIYDTIVN